MNGAYHVPTKVHNRLYRELATWLLPTALRTDNGMALVTALIEEMRRRKIVAPVLSLIERLAWETRHRAQRLVFKYLAAALTTQQQAQLDALLTPGLERRYTPLAWLRQPPGKPAPATILKLVERLMYIRTIGIDPLLGDVPRATHRTHSTPSRSHL